MRFFRTFRALRLVSAVVFVGVFLYGEAHPEYFGNLGSAFFTLFTVVTLEGWPDLTRKIMSTNPLAWLYFVPYVILAAFIIANVLVGVIVEAVQESTISEALSAPENSDALSTELLQLERQINVIRSIIKAEKARSDSDQTPK